MAKFHCSIKTTYLIEADNPTSAMIILEQIADSTKKTGILSSSSSRGIATMDNSVPYGIDSSEGWRD